MVNPSSHPWRPGREGPQLECQGKPKCGVQFCGVERARYKLMSRTHICPMCGAIFHPRRRTHLTCSVTCRNQFLNYRRSVQALTGYWIKFVQGPLSGQTRRWHQPKLPKTFRTKRRGELWTYCFWKWDSPIHVLAVFRLAPTRSQRKRTRRPRSHV